MMQPLVAYYGDDFTGSTDVMEVLQWSGLRTVLFMEPPTGEQLQAFPNLRAFGIAGRSRAMATAAMASELRPALECLRASGAEVIHYKTCSTFDSSPEIGSIGRALEIGREVCGDNLVPIMIGAPNLGRYQVFGNLFARSGLDSEPYRLDRHPTMRQHPITPMTEADLRLHLAAQTDLQIGLYDVLRLNETPPSGSTASLRTWDEDAILFDVLYPEHLPRIGQQIQGLMDARSPVFVVGSSGIEYALTEHLARAGRLESLRTHSPGHPPFGATDQLVAITGSCSPVNGRQIACAEQHGFVSLPLDTARLVYPETSGREVERAVEQALDQVQKGASVLLHSSRGPCDPRVAETAEVFRSLGFSDLDIKLRSAKTIGPTLGKILKGILTERPFSRVGVAGGDTSGYVARELKITALEAIAPVAPGSPLCRAYAESTMGGTEFFFKGGQVGKDDVWATMLKGTE